MEQYLDILGKAVRDKVTKFTGVATSVSFDLYGCIQVVVTPERLASAPHHSESAWYDIGRLEVTDSTQVMPVPDFSRGQKPSREKGPAPKPMLRG